MTITNNAHAKIKAANTELLDVIFYGLDRSSRELNHTTPNDLEGNSARKKQPIKRL